MSPRRVAVDARRTSSAISANMAMPTWIGTMNTTQAIIQTAYQTALSPGETSSVTTIGRTRPGARSASVSAWLGKPVRTSSRASGRRTASRVR